MKLAQVIKTIPFFDVRKTFEKKEVPSHLKKSSIATINNFSGKNFR